MSDFIRSKIFEIVENQDTAQKLLPSDHPFATKRPPIDTNYFETYNRKNVHLVDVRENPISKLDKHGLVLEDGTTIEADIIVFATGFDAMSGALLNMDIVGKKGLRLCDAWREGPKTYLGVGVAHFPNMFIVTGPGSPSVLTNMPRSIEQNVNWISDLLQFAESNKVRSVEAREEAMLQWTEHVNTVASNTLLPKANHSWYLGANIPGKPRVFMPYAGGLDVYSAHCEDVANDGYSGFEMIGDNATF
jgi:cation diffusion facilitator CzcD-associated flavoprotein CzcO